MAWVTNHTTGIATNTATGQSFQAAMPAYSSGTTYSPSTSSSSSSSSSSSGGSSSGSSSSSSSGSSSSSSSSALITMVRADGQTITVSANSPLRQSLVSQGFSEKTKVENIVDIAKNDPFIAEQFKNQEVKDNFDKLNPELQSAYLQLMKSLGQTISAGQVINPNIEITPEKVREFTDQATKELDPYYQELIGNYKKDLNDSILRLKHDFETGIRNAEEPFRKNMAAVSELEAQSGLTYGSERVVREKENIRGQQELIDKNVLDVSRLAEDAYKTTERTLGSDAFRDISVPGLSNYNVNKQGFAEAGLRNLYSPQGRMVGSLQKEKTTNIANRASVLEDAYRQKRVLNTSQLTPNSTVAAPSLNAPKLGSTALVSPLTGTPSTVKAKNPQTGGIFNINPADYESQYRNLGWTLI